MLLLVLLGLAWTRLPDAHGSQVLISLLLPLAILAAALALQAGTMRAFLDAREGRVRLVWGALTLLLWAAVVWAFWWFLDWCDLQFWSWASYLNSKAPASLRARAFTYQHIYLLLVAAEWILRWIVTPAKVIPYAMASAQWGWRLRWRRALHLLWSWRWWVAVTLAACIAVLVPGQLFSGIPRGTVSHQVWAVIFKLLASWILVLGSWIILLAWAAVLLMPSPGSEPDEEALVAVGLPRDPSPRRSAAALPLPESRDDDAYGNA
jgi:hypothetical protein